VPSAVTPTIALAFAALPAISEASAEGVLR
jgi:hypothetical protein